MYRIVMKLLLTLLIISITTATPVYACTLWAANGTDVESGGSLIVKNRDWIPDHSQELKYVTPDNGFNYIGIFAVDGEYSGLKAGVNEKGLVVVSASASSIPMRERRQMPGTHKLLHKLLASCSSVDEVIDRKGLFLGPRFLMFADKNKVGFVEIGPGGSVAIQVKENGTIYHTNHYVDDQMAHYNKNIGVSSKKRYERIQELLDTLKRPYDLHTFISFSHDTIAGADNSIFRVGSTNKKAKTLAVWAVSLPKNQAPELYVEILNPGEAEQRFQFVPFLMDGTINNVLDIPLIRDK